MFVVALLSMAANAVLAVVMAYKMRQLLRREPEGIFSKTATLIWVVGAGAQTWLLLAGFESILFLFVPYPLELAPVLYAILSGCLLWLALASWIVSRARPRWAFDAERGAVTLTVGILFFFEILQHRLYSGVAPWLAWLLLGVCGIVVVEAGTLMLIEVRKNHYEFLRRVAMQSEQN